MPVTADPCALAERYYSAVNALDFDAIEAFFAEDAVYHSVKVGSLDGRAEILAAFRRYFAEYPDQVARNSLVEALSPLSVRAVWSLTATSATTGQPFERQGEEILTFDEAGKILRVEVIDR